MNAAVLFRNIAMSGTFSHRITAAARFLASVCLSLNVPSAAYTSIIGNGRLLQLQTLNGMGFGIHRTVCIFHPERSGWPGGRGAFMSVQSDSVRMTSWL